MNNLIKQIDTLEHSLFNIESSIDESPNRKEQDELLRKKTKLSKKLNKLKRKLNNADSSVRQNQSESSYWR